MDSGTKIKMPGEFLAYIKSNSLLDLQKTTLLAVSGGVDSMVMLDLFLRNNLKVAVAHVDHGTRNGMSGKDASFVQQFCQKQNIIFHLKKLDFSNIDHSNFQVTAREKRYQWFYELCESHDYQSIATAHQRSDALESFFLHLARGAGLDGLSGIRVKNQSVIRPLMFTDRSEIETYANLNKIAYVHDQSNDTDDYKRNEVRHHIIPTFNSLFPTFDNNAYKSIENVHDSAKLLQHLIRQNEHNWVERRDKQVIIQIDKIRGIPGALSLLYYLLKDYGFTRDQLANMLTPHKAGAIFLGIGYKALLDRNVMIIRPERLNEKVHLLIDKPGHYPLSNGIIELSEVDEVDFASDFQYLDTDTISFPLLLRNRHDGDIFQPLGMNGKHQKVKDYLINQKINLFEKEETLVLLSNDEIIAIVGHRINEKVKIKPDTKNILSIRILK